MSAAAWIAILVASPRQSAHAGHAMSGSGTLSGWMTMVAAMMFPMLIWPVRFVASHSRWARRNRSVAVFLAGYCAVWLVFGLAVETLIEPLRGASWPWTGGCCLLAAAWQWTPLKRTGVLGCHRTMPLAPSGIRADIDCFCYGLTIGGNCWLSCWALMLACSAAGHSVWAMLAATALVWVERAWPDRARAVFLRFTGSIEVAR